MSVMNVVCSATKKNLTLKTRVFLIAGRPTCNQRETGKRIRATVDAVDGGVWGVSIEQVVENINEYAVRGHFGHFGRRSRASHAHGSAHAHVITRTRAGRRPKCPKCPSIEKYIYISNGWIVDTCASAVSKVSIGIENAQIFNDLIMPDELLASHGLKMGAGRACGGFFGGCLGKTKQCGSEGQIEQFQALRFEGRSSVERHAVEPVAKNEKNQRLEGMHTPVVLTSVRHSYDRPPQSRHGATPWNGPPTPFVARFTVLARPFRNGSGAKTNSRRNIGAWGRGKAGAGAASRATGNGDCRHG